MLPLYLIFNTYELINKNMNQKRYENAIFLTLNEIYMIITSITKCFA